jgi:hypothetical protein
MRRYGKFVDRIWIQQRMNLKDARFAQRMAAQAERRRLLARWYCGMCEKLFTKGGDCPLCGFTLESMPRMKPDAVTGGEQ